MIKDAFTENNIKAYISKIIKGELDVDSTDLSKQTALSFFVTSLVRDGVFYSNPEDVIKALCKKGANVDFVGKDSYTPIQMAILNEKYDIVSILLPYHKKGDQSDYKILAMSADVTNPNFFEIILQTGFVDPTVTRPTGGNILHYLAKNDRMMKIKKLHNFLNDIDINVLDRKGMTPLTVAINENALKSAVLLKTLGGVLKGIVTRIDLAVETEIVDEDFFIEYPDAYIIALDKGKEHLLPNTIKDVFIF